MRKDEDAFGGVRACVAGVCWAGPDRTGGAAPPSSTPQEEGEATGINHPPPLQLFASNDASAATERSRNYSHHLWRLDHRHPAGSPPLPASPDLDVKPK